MKGNYVPSCLGNYLDYLVRQPHPIHDKCELLPADSLEIQSIPKEIWRIIDILCKYPNPVSYYKIHNNLDI